MNEAQQMAGSGQPAAEYVRGWLCVRISSALVYLLLAASGCGNRTSTTPPTEANLASPLDETATPAATTVSAANDPPPAASRQPPAASTSPAASRQPPAAGGSRLPVRPSSSKARGVRDLSFDDIKFEMEKGTPFLRTMFTPEIEALFGQKIRIRGWILPTDRQTLTSFVLVRDNMECCFGPGAALYDCVVVNMAPGKTAEFTTKPIAVEGTFAFKEMLDPEGGHLAIYQLTAEKAE